MLRAVRRPPRALAARAPRRRGPGALTVGDFQLGPVSDHAEDAEMANALPEAMSEDASQPASGSSWEVITQSASSASETPYTGSEGPGGQFAVLRPRPSGRRTPGTRTPRSESSSFCSRMGRWRHSNTHAAVTGARDQVEELVDGFLVFVFIEHRWAPPTGGSRAGPINGSDAGSSSDALLSVSARPC